jgi:transglutaminase-like putative cysteine protease
MKLTIRAHGAIEDSVPMRVVAALAVEVAIIAVVAQGAVDGFTAVCALLAAPAGYLFSYRQRHHSALTTKILLSIGLLVAFAQFLSTVRTATTIDQARIPLASLFLWVQVLHSFDVPRRRDLSFSMMSSVVLMAEAGALSLTTSLLWFMVVWAGLASVWLFLSSAPPAGAITPMVSTRRRRSKKGRAAPVRFVGLSASVVTAATIAVFLAMPRLPGTFVHTPPFSLSGAQPVGDFSGAVSNPGLPGPTDGVVNYATDAYPGFSDIVDLRARGHLSDDIAFRVRSSQASLWRAEVFDTFDGSRWTIGDPTTTVLPSLEDGGGASMPQSADGPIGVPTVPVTQTFYIQSPQPNVLFAAYRPTQIYFPAGGLRTDAYDSVRSPIYLDTGMVYSVVSNVPITDARTLRSAVPLHVSPDDPDLELPRTMPQRVAGLAAQITAGKSTEYDKVIAVQDWIAANTQYDLNVARDPAGVDTVDRFLFVTHRGFCEQIASAMAVLLRTQGIPTRLVTGYGPGTWNPFTGYYEVKQSDAHAWLEVYYPSIGWVPYDPTFGVPEASGSGAHFVTPQILAAIGNFVRRVVPAPVKTVVAATARGVGRAASWAWRHWMLAAAMLVAAAAVVAWRRRRTRTRLPPEVGAGIAFNELVAALSTAGHRRDPHRTPTEYLVGVQADSGLAPDVVEAAELVVRTFERERFGRVKPSPADVMRARAVAARVRELVRP